MVVAMGNNIVQAKLSLIMGPVYWFIRSVRWTTFQFFSTLMVGNLRAGVTGRTTRGAPQIRDDRSTNSMWQWIGVVCGLPIGS